MKPSVILIGLIVVVAILSGGFAVLTTGKVAAPSDLASKGLAAMRTQNAIFYGVFMPAVVGLLAYFAFRWVSTRWPETATTSFLILTAVLLVILTAGWVAMFKGRALVEITVIHLIYAAGFGWLMPILLTRPQILGLGR